MTNTGQVWIKVVCIGGQKDYISSSSPLSAWVIPYSHPSRLPPPLAQITDVGGLALCKAAKGALVLSRLNLSGNEVADGTMLAVADALRFNTGL